MEKDITVREHSKRVSVADQLRFPVIMHVTIAEVVRIEDGFLAIAQNIAEGSGALSQAHYEFTLDGLHFDVNVKEAR